MEIPSKIRQAVGNNVRRFQTETTAVWDSGATLGETKKLQYAAQDVRI